jgi:hypothetical protein
MYYVHPQSHGAVFKHCHFVTVNALYVNETQKVRNTAKLDLSH